MQMKNYIIQTILIGLTYLAAAKAMYFLMFALVIIDFITGVWKAVLLNGIWKYYDIRILFTTRRLKFKLPIAGLNSHTMKRSVVKITCYSFAILTTFLLETEIFGTGIILTKIVTGFIALVETASIFENLAKISGMNVFNKIFDTIATYFNKNKNIINKIDGTIEDSNKNNGVA